MWRGWDAVGGCLLGDPAGCWRARTRSREVIIYFKYNYTTTLLLLERHPISGTSLSLSSAEGVGIPTWPFERSSTAQMEPEVDDSVIPGGARGCCFGGDTGRGRSVAVKEIVHSTDWVGSRKPRHTKGGGEAKARPEGLRPCGWPRLVQAVAVARLTQAVTLARLAQAVTGS